MSSKPKLNQHKAKILLLICLSLTAGVAAAAWSPVSFDNRAIFCLAWLALVLAIWQWPARLAAVFLIAAGLSFGYWRYQAANDFDPRDLRNYYNQDLMIVGRVSAEPEASDNSWKLTIAAEQLVGQGEARGKFIVFAPLSATYAYGDSLQIDCWLEPPLANKNFDAERYWRRFGLVGACQAGQLKFLGNQGNWFYKQIINLRHWASGRIKAGLPYPEADLGGAMTIGVGNKLPADLKTAFSQSGLTHIIAISGLNVSLLVALLLGSSLALGIKRQWSLWLSLAAVIFYVVLVGAPASAVRAGVMGVLFLLAAWLGRLNKLINALSYAAALSLLANPFLLRDDIGWQLSFLALLGIIYLYPLLRLWPKSSLALVNLLLDGLALTIAAQLATAPIIALNFQQLSLVAPLANLLAVWTTPFILVAMFGALLLSLFISWSLWWLPALVFLKYLIAVAMVAANLPWASLPTNRLKPAVLFIYYLLLIAAVAIGQKALKRKEQLARLR